jgi:hypothetical protein
MTTAPIRKLRRRQRRKRKLRYLRRRVAEAKDANERLRLIAKMRRISLSVCARAGCIAAQIAHQLVYARIP